MSLKPVILVADATGVDGNSLIHALLSENKFRVRCLTLNLSSLEALALKKEGVEIVQGDIDDTENLKEAIKDCYGVFGVASFWLAKNAHLFSLQKQPQTRHERNYWI